MGEKSQEKSIGWGETRLEWKPHRAGTQEPVQGKEEHRTARTASQDEAGGKRFLYFNQLLLALFFHLQHCISLAFCHAYISLLFSFISPFPPLTIRVFTFRACLPHLG